MAFKLHGEGIRGSKALSITLQGCAPVESFLYSPSRHVEHVWDKIPQFHRSLVGWAGATEPPAHNKIDENLGPRFNMVRTNIFSKKYVRVLYMSFHSYRVVFCAPIPMGPRTPDFGSCSMSYSL